MDWNALADDASVVDEAELWRRIHPSWIVRDENRSGLRVSSAAFDDSPDGSPTSILLAQLVHDTGRDETDVLLGFDGYALASLAAAGARGCGHGIARDPLPEEPAHACLLGRKTKSSKRCLSRCSAWAIIPA